MRRWLQPRYMVPKVTDLTDELLAGLGIRGVILDADNTLVPRQCYDFEPEVRQWVEAHLAAGRRLCILSNSQHFRKVAQMVAGYDIPTISLARKPLRSGFARALRAIGTRPEETAMVGDQLLTDILGGNLAGLTTIMVAPLSGNDFVLYKLVRPFERRLVRRWGPRHQVAGGG